MPADHDPAVPEPSDHPKRSPVVVIGASNVDIKARSEAMATLGTSNPGSATTSPGGVARNVAEGMGRLGSAVVLISRIGNDRWGDLVVSRTAAAGVDVTRLRRGPTPTGSYTAVLQRNGELIIAVADMVATELIDAAQVVSATELIAAAPMLILDANLMVGTLSAALTVADHHQVRVVIDPVSVPKAQRVTQVMAGRTLFAVTPNVDELEALSGLPVGTRVEIERAAMTLVEAGVDQVWVHAGAAGSLLAQRDGSRHWLPPVPAHRVVDVTGAGDAALAGYCHALLSGADPVSAARFGHATASLTITSADTVRPDLTTDLVNRLLASHPGPDEPIGPQ